ncbi:MAG: hypothetical protein HYV27_03755 [Candidatus Hydrogenedentes bacterium]|nr:hypothetical protein [Candidatus Hydrogenedentota bacterium]
MPYIDSLPLEAFSGARCLSLPNTVSAYPPHELYPLAHPAKGPVARLQAVLLDMDGTLVYTEPLYLGILEGVARALGVGAAWKGFDAVQDYPRLIGNSVTTHLHYVIAYCSEHFAPACFVPEVARSLRANAAHAMNCDRAEETRHHMRVLGLEHGDAEAWCATWTVAPPEAMGVEWRLAGATEIYYAALAEALTQMEPGGDGGNGIRLAEGLAPFLALISGAMHPVRLEEAALLAGILNADHPGEVACRGDDAIAMAATIARDQPRIGVVTSATGLEARAILGGICKELTRQIGTWPLEDAKRERLLARCANAEALFETITTASESYEHRLKPHPDLYRIALGKLGAGESILEETLVFEDSEAGTVAAGAAGIRHVCALATEQTRHHRYPQASWMCSGGFGEVVRRWAGFVAG